MDDRPLDDLKEFSTTITTDINDLPVTSPHGSDFEHHAQILGFAAEPNARRGTAAAHYSGQRQPARGGPLVQHPRIRCRSSDNQVGIRNLQWMAEQPGIPR